MGKNRAEGMTDRVRQAYGPLVLFGMMLLLATPALHPLLTPYTGVTSHLLWWLHVAAVAQVAYLYRWQGAVIAITSSFLLIVSGERLFGAGYGTPARYSTSMYPPCNWSNRASWRGCWLPPGNTALTTTPWYWKSRKPR